MFQNKHSNLKASKNI